MFGLPRRHFFETDSTNVRARIFAAEGAPEGSVVTADHQTAGRGRFDRSWISPAGRNLLASWVLYPCRGLDDWPSLSLLASVVICEAVEELCGVEAQVKWPNDVMAGSEKLAGVLLESAVSAKPVVIVGVGVNVNQMDFEGGFAVKPVSLAALTRREWSRDELLTGISSALERWYAKWSSEGPAGVIDAWIKRAPMLGGIVRVTEGGASVDAIARGIAPDGGLLVQDAAGNTRTVYAGEVSLRSTHENREFRDE